LRSFEAVTATLYGTVALLGPRIAAIGARFIPVIGWAVALGGLLGGAIGNLIDRMTRLPGPGRGYVVDFIQLPHYAIFNVADSCIVGAGVLMVILALRGVPFRGPTS
jgi:signal peptidase II